LPDNSKRCVLLAARSSNILIPALRELRDGYSVRIATSWPQALRASQEFALDLAIADRDIGVAGGLFIEVTSHRPGCIRLLITSSPAPTLPNLVDAWLGTPWPQGLLRTEVDRLIKAGR
jgi:hypothetical protein